MYDLDRIMTRAWETYRNGNADFAEALHSSWVTEKEMIPESDPPASETEGESETRYGNEKRSYLKMMGNETVNQMPKNVVVADCQSGNYSVKTDPIWQYDYGIVLQIQGVELPSTYEVHFSNNPLGFSKTQIGDENGVRIPDEYLLTGQMVYAWLFLHEGAEDGETKLSISIPVRRRAMPLDEEPTSGEKSVITQTIAALNQAVSDVEAAAEEVKSLSRVEINEITLTHNDGYDTYTSEMSGREIKELIDNGVTVIARVDGNYLMPISLIGSASLLFKGAFFVDGSNPYGEDSELVYIRFIMGVGDGHGMNTFWTGYRIPRILVVNATRKNIDGAYYLVLDKTYGEIHESSFAVIKFEEADWGTGRGSIFTWYIYSVNETPKKVHAVSIESNSSISMQTFTAESDDDYPKKAI